MICIQNIVKGRQTQNRTDQKMGYNMNQGSQENFSEHSNCVPLNKKSSTTESTDFRGLGARKETGLDKLTQSKHNRVSIFSRIVTSVYIISDTDLGTLVLFFSVYL